MSWRLGNATDKVQPDNKVVYVLGRAKSYPKGVFTYVAIGLFHFV